MSLIEDYQKELARIQVLNQRYGFLLNAMQYVKIRQAGAPGDLKFEIMERNVTSVLETLINSETSPLPQPAIPKKPTELGLI